jgi:rare lipoprotein A
MSKRLRVVVMSIALVMMTTSCARNKHVKAVPQAPRPQAKPVKIGDVERGIASWYGHPYHGRRAANGEVYDMRQMTAAHRTMPFGTWVKVDNESNGKSVNVRITDRGPFVDNRIIDLSQRAAEEIGLIGPGIGPVKLTVIEPPRGQTRETYGVQIAAVEERERAELLRRELGETYGPVHISEKPASNDEPLMYRVIVGEGTKEQAEEILRKLRAAGRRGFVTRQATLERTN